jgi:hypothetical protein
MSHNRPPHECASCRLCEAISCDGYRRYWKVQEKARAWHVIADGPHWMGRLPREAHFITILSNRLGTDGSLAHYCGPLYWEFDATDPAAALNDLRRCLQVLEMEYGSLCEALHLWHSGRRGFHATLPPVVFGAEAGHPRLPRVYAAMVEQLFPPQVAPSLDRSVYSAGKGRMWRLPNRRRSDNGRYKVPLSVREALHKVYGDLEAMTRSSREGIFWPSDEDLSPCPGLVQLYQDVVATLERTTPLSARRRDEGARIPEGQRNATLASLAGSMRRRGASEATIAAALQAENLMRCDPPLADSEILRIAKSVGRYAPAPQHDPTPSWGEYWERRQRAYNERLHLPLKEVQAHG